MSTKKYQQIRIGAHLTPIFLNRSIAHYFSKHPAWKSNDMSGIVIFHHGQSRQVQKAFTMTRRDGTSAARNPVQKSFPVSVFPCKRIPTFTGKWCVCVFPHNLFRIHPKIDHFRMVWLCFCWQCCRPIIWLSFREAWICICICQLTVKVRVWPIPKWRFPPKSSIFHEINHPFCDIPSTCLQFPPELGQQDGIR